MKNTARATVNYRMPEELRENSQDHLYHYTTEHAKQELPNNRESFAPFEEFLRILKADFPTENRVITYTNAILEAQSVV